MQSETNAVHPSTAAKRDALREQLQPLIDALLVAVARVTAVGVDVKDSAVKADEMTDEQQHEVEQLVHAQQQFYARIEEQLTVVAHYLSAIEALPRTVYDACVQSATFQLDFETAASNALHATDVWRELDVMSARTRIAVVERLVASGLTPTRAKDEASGDPEYTQLKDRIADAAKAKERADVERDVSIEKLRTARDIMRGLVQVSEARAGGASVVLQRSPEQTQSSEDAAQRTHDENGVRTIGSASSVSQGPVS